MAEINSKTTLSAVEELSFVFFLIKIESKVTDKKKRQILETLMWGMKFYGGGV